MVVVLTAKGTTDRGLIRAENQDAFMIDPNLCLYIVADGMGGHAGGEIASSLCTEEVARFFASQKEQGLTAPHGKPHPNPDIHQQMTSAINRASTRIYERALEEPALRGMGTTATLLQVCDNYGYCAHVGDSRLYLIRCGYIYQLTRDHSLVSEQVAAGLISEEEARSHQLRNVITRSVGYQEEELVDNIAIPLYHDDLLLLCSDGLYGRISDQEIASLVTSQKCEAVDNLVDLANERGGDDNITVVIIKVTIRES